MSKLSSKITIASIVIAAIVGASIYFTSTQGENETANHSSITNNVNTATLTSVWDKETEPFYQGIKEITVYRSPNCGCCGEWIKHAQKHGFKVEDIKTEEMEALKRKYNVPPELASCHTAIVDGYVMEGHIPVDDIKRFLKAKPELAGLSVPGMPLGTPGMEAGETQQPFEVLAFNAKGEVEVFKEYQSY